MTIKTLAAFIFGVAVGGVGGFFLTRETMKTKQQLEINEMRDYYKEKYHPGTKEKMSPVEAKEGELVTMGDGKDIYTALDDISKDYHTESDIVTEKTKEENKTFKSQYQKPYEITAEQYNDNVDNLLQLEYIWHYHQKVMVTYDDGELIVIEDPYVQVGLDNLEALEESGEGVIYVRNDNRGELYFIQLSANEPNIDPETYASPLPEDDEDDIY